MNVQEQIELLIKNINFKNNISNPILLAYNFIDNEINYNFITRNYINYIKLILMFKQLLIY